MSDATAELPEGFIRCKNFDECHRTFKPTRKNQKFHNGYCRDDWWEKHWKDDKHACPVCGAEHAAPVRD